jgi:hypothetical protein
MKNNHKYERLGKNKTQGEMGTSGSFNHSYSRGRDQKNHG